MYSFVANITYTVPIFQGEMFLEVVVDLMFLLILIAWPPKLTYVFEAAFIKTFVFEGERILLKQIILTEGGGGYRCVRGRVSARAR